MPPATHEALQADKPAPSSAASTDINAAIKPTQQASAEPVQGAGEDKDEAWCGTVAEWWPTRSQNDTSLQQLRARGAQAMQGGASRLYRSPAAMRFSSHPSLRRYRDKKIRAAKRAARSELSVTRGEWCGAELLALCCECCAGCERLLRHIVNAGENMATQLGLTCCLLRACKTRCRACTGG
jgi:hypothetical protein